MTVELLNPKATLATGAISISELDGSPASQSIELLKFSNNAVTLNGDGSASITTGVGGGGDVSSNTALSIIGEVALFADTSGKLVKRSTLTGMLKSAAGVLQSATPGTDYAPITTGTAILKGDGAGGFASTSPGTDYLLPNGNGSQLTNLTKTQVGLSNVDNTTDLNKPISTLTQTALDLKAPKATPSFTGSIRSLLLGNENVVLDARTSPRQITLGVFRIEHTAGISGTRPISLDVACNGFADTHAIDVNYLATGLIAGDESHGYDFHVNTADSTGGTIAAFAISKTGTGTVDVVAIETYPGIDVIEQDAGAVIVADANLVFSSAVYTDRTVEFGAIGNDVSLFVNDNDYIYIGHSVKFSAIEVSLSILATGAGIIPTFEYSDGAASFAAFGPGDGTNGFRQNGNITIPSGITNWVTRTVDGVTGKFWIRIRRTNAAIITAPSESTIKVVISSKYSWDSTGNVNVSTLNIKNLPTFSNRTNAIDGGLVSGDVFRDTNYSLWIV